MGSGPCMARNDTRGWRGLRKSALRTRRLDNVAVRPIHALFTTAQTSGSRPGRTTPPGFNSQAPGRTSMRHRPLRLAALVLGLATAPLHAQVPVHKHYQPTTDLFDTASESGARAPRLQKVGKHVFPVTTQSQQAQLFMNQGLNLTYGFNHAEAGRAFAEAARLDPSLAIAYWGQALVLGPNINAPMAPDTEPKAFELLQKAIALKADASPRERAYIDALSSRYTGRAEDRAAGDRAYADAMRALAD